MNSEDLIKKGLAAKALLESHDFNLAMDTVRLQTFRAWADTKPEEATKREENYYLMQGVSRIIENLQALVSNAKFEQHKADQRTADEKSSAERQPQGE